MTVKAQFPDESVEGRFVRQGDAFRDWVRADGSTEYAPEFGRYHLYVSLACPWAHRTVIVRALKGLEDAIGMSVVDPVRDDLGWAFRQVDDATTGDPVNGLAYLAEAYQLMDRHYHGRVTVPVLWDTRTKRIVSNSDDDIMRMFETEFDALARHDVDLYPHEHRAAIDELNDVIYETVNDGVYRAGFAATQDAYEPPAYRLFEELDALDARLANRRYLFGAAPVETDWRLFVTLIRFDAVYHGHFKCNLRRIADYPNLSGYVRDLYQIRGIAATVNFDHIKRHYYMTHEEINPTGIVPIGPLQNFDAPHGREHVSA
ncbi:MAG: glutathionyl-hydroquinone reductase [Candidatus Eremiobacteraeota bacterium]|jgi:putative glutathione S-transferase|nr:glutathionyl-hydroquinone reductase [Candidatus Eremiobacteraeota bacterium]